MVSFSKLTAALLALLAVAAASIASPARAQDESSLIEAFEQAVMRGCVPNISKGVAVDANADETELRKLPPEDAEPLLQGAAGEVWAIPALTRALPGMGQAFVTRFESRPCLAVLSFSSRHLAEAIVERLKESLLTSDPAYISVGDGQRTYFGRIEMTTSSYLGEPDGRLINVFVNLGKADVGGWHLYVAVEEAPPGTMTLDDVREYQAEIRASGHADKEQFAGAVGSAAVDACLASHRTGMSFGGHLAARGFEANDAQETSERMGADVAEAWIRALNPENPLETSTATVVFFADGRCRIGLVTYSMSIAADIADRIHDRLLADDSELAQQSDETEDTGSGHTTRRRLYHGEHDTTQVKTFFGTAADYAKGLLENAPEGMDVPESTDAPEGLWFLEVTVERIPH